MTTRDGIWQYKRRVPTALQEIDERAPHVRISLGTDDLAKARELRNAYEQADNELWASMLDEDDIEAARKRYSAAVKRADALGYRYRTADDLAANAKWDELARRFDTAMAARDHAPTAKAVLGGAPVPAVTIESALKVYMEEIAPPSLLGKSLQQRRKWEVIPKRAVSTFVDVVGNLAIADISNDDARAFYKHWLARIAPIGKGTKPTHSASSGNRQIGALRTLYRDYFEYMGIHDRQNPFTGMSFSERKTRSRPPFPTAWIRDKILGGGSLSGLNEEARAILLIIVETGARPSEICNLTKTGIMLNHKVPHLSIEPREDDDDPRELKTDASRREVPLIGAALAAAKKFPDGFPRYRESEEAFCAAVNKYLRENKLTPTPKHTIYSFRHSFEDRMKEAGIQDEMRRIFFGHRRNREEYGEGGSLEWRRKLLMKVALPFNKAII